jgi:hypothetical protein
MSSKLTSTVPIKSRKEEVFEGQEADDIRSCRIRQRNDITLASVSSKSLGLISTSNRCNLRSTPRPITILLFFFLNQGQEVRLQTHRTSTLQLSIVQPLWVYWLCTSKSAQHKIIEDKSTLLTIAQ